MIADVLLAETIARADGVGPVIDLLSKRGKRLILTLGITRITAQQSIEVSVWGSAGHENWGSRPMATIPHKFYCGIYSVPLNLERHPEIRIVRLQWKMSRWRKEEAQPMCEFYVHAEQPEKRMSIGVA